MFDKLDKRWLAFIVLCFGTLMIVLDTTIVNVALPSIKSDLGFTDTSLAWVVNAYLLTFGGFLLLGGRLGDLYGCRRLFIGGITLFTFASLACGLVTSQELLIIARGLQGMGGAVVSAVGFSLVMNMFLEPSERTNAMGIFGFIAAGGGSIGVLLGGFLTTIFDWHSIFLVNIPIGIIVVIFSFKLLPSGKAEARPHLDVAGALTITASIMLAVYAIVNGNQLGWASTSVLGLLAAALAFLIAFIYVESKARHPLVPLKLFKLRNLTAANLIGVLWAAGMFAWFFISALYLQLVLHYSPMQVGLSFLPANLLMALLSVGVSAKLVMRFGVRAPLAAGLVLAALGLLLLARAPLDGNFMTDVLPSMLLLGLGAGIVFNPLLLAAMSDVVPSESGLASGVVNTSFMMGGALGLALLASLAASTTNSLFSSGATELNALNEGYHAAFLAGSLFVSIGAVLCLLFIRKTLLAPRDAVHV